jgi:NAD(P)-dependent dehydrogenase (short-subunit alcohol dehydrogenase family)
MIVMGLAENMVPGLRSGRAVGGAPYPRRMIIGLKEIAWQRCLGVAMGRGGDAAEIAEGIAFLACPASSYITGVALPIAGGTSVGL